MSDLCDLLGIRIDPWEVDAVITMRRAYVTERQALTNPPPPNLNMGVFDAHFLKR